MQANVTFADITAWPLHIQNDVRTDFEALYSLVAKYLRLTRKREKERERERERDRERV
jgi:hypothetical protein